ncbi:MAG: tRNA preQ1(34) S-adenosylmethionine ribosyltransferase-isomerase QueA [Oscillospiraceae bacterium]
MLTHDFYYDLPQHFIAQHPIEPRDSSKLLVLDKNTGEIAHSIFHDIIDMLNPNDVLILNDSRVLPARLLGKKKDGEAHIELLLLEQKSMDTWETLSRPGKKAKIGTHFIFGDGLLEAEILEVLEGGNRLVKFYYDGNFYDILEKIGSMPLPPYITEKLEDPERYQTVYSKEVGSAAAPTAGLHFTKELLQRIADKGVKVKYLTLHVGLGTFRPVKADNITDHKMHSEHYFMPQDTADAINECKNSGGRVIAVGTTSCRTLETLGLNGFPLKECEGYTDIFIYPGKKFNVIDGLITNFHLPESTLVMLVSALAGRENILNAYEVAKKNDYRFFSFGDAMFIK